MSDRRDEILRKEANSLLLFEVLDDDLNGVTKKEIFNAMDENGKKMCIDLLEYMAENGYECAVVNKEPVFLRKLSVGWESLNKEQLFENFL